MVCHGARCCSCVGVLPLVWSVVLRWGWCGLLVGVLVGGEGLVYSVYFLLDGGCEGLCGGGVDGVGVEVHGVAVVGDLDVWCVVLGGEVWW